MCSVLASGIANCIAGRGSKRQFLNMIHAPVGQVIALGALLGTLLSNHLLLACHLQLDLCLLLPAGM